MKIWRIYADTSVIGGCCDEEFADDSMRLIRAVRTGRALLLVSDMVFAEVKRAPPRVQAVLADLPSHGVELVPLDDRVTGLRDAYLSGAVVGAKSIGDATHVAAASVARADAIVSWNFRHIVRLDKMQAYNRINRVMGFPDLTIITPKELPDELDEYQEEDL